MSTSSEEALLRPAPPAAAQTRPRSQLRTQPRPGPLPPELARALVGVRTFDGLAECLRTLRAVAGEPSYAEIVRRIGLYRGLPGQPPRSARPAQPEPERLPGRVTVYDCFRAGRRRMDAELVADVVRALGADPGPWRAALAEAAAGRGARPARYARPSSARAPATQLRTP